VGTAPDNKLFVNSDGGQLYLVDPKSRNVEVVGDLTADPAVKGFFGGLPDIEAATWIDGSPFAFLGIENIPCIVEYEWHMSKRVFRVFNLEKFRGRDNLSLEGLAWVPVPTARNQGYFYAASELTGAIFIYDVPILKRTGRNITASLVRKWTSPDVELRALTGIAFIDNYLFLSFDDGDGNMVLIYKVDELGFPGPLQEQYRVDVEDCSGVAIRRQGREAYEVFFTSDSKQKLYAFVFRFQTGFDIHPFCAEADQGAWARRLNATMV